EIEFSGGFTDLHTLSYQQVLAGNGFGVECARKSIQTVYDIRNSEIIESKGDYHPFLKKR
ncbi:MAG: oxidoreductase, partial [Bacteroidales bacterium]|nr:oxidoreductase [Bacteroidales bacterium]